MFRGRGIYSGLIFGAGVVYLYQKPVTFRGFSRYAGDLADIEIPVWARSPVFRAYSGFFNCDLKEIAVQDLRNYKTFGNFFRRSLREGCRPVCVESPIVSPCDGRILYLKKCQSSDEFSVKGTEFGPQTFLGEEKIPSSLYLCTIYLSPGDYHHFHSPVDWKVEKRTHFSGYLLSVNPLAFKLFKNLLSLNERVVYTGSWKHGFFSVTAVGATNVGSIKIVFDKTLLTNSVSQRIGSIQKTLTNSLSLHKGEPFGEFNLGSTIVLLFEGPDNLKFNFKDGDTVKMGQSLYQG